MKEGKLQKFMRENRDRFDIYEPDPKIWDRIKPDTQKDVSRLNWKMIAWRTAAAGIIFFITLFVAEYFFKLDGPITRLTVTGREEYKIPELQEAEIYYTSQLQSKLIKVREYLIEHPELENELIRDLSALDSIRTELKKDLKDNIANKEVVEALIQNYRMKLTILEDLLEHLEHTEGVNENEKEQHEL